jgi:hypothetical protein
MVYSRFMGPGEGAGLVFAHTVQEARVVGWKNFCSLFTDDYLDFAAFRLKETWHIEYADKTKLEIDKAHAIYDHPYCHECGLWGDGGRIGDDGLCNNCREEITKGRV